MHWRRCEFQSAIPTIFKNLNRYPWLVQKINLFVTSIDIGMVKIKAVFFDLDNTLIDFMGMKRKASKAAIKAMIRAGLRVDEKKAWQLLQGLFREHGIEDQKIFDKFLRRTTGDVDISVLAAGVVAYRRVKRRMLKPYPNVRRTLAALSKQCKLAIVTDAPKFQAWTRLYEMELERYFDFVISFEDTGVAKSEKLPFRKAFRIMKIKPGDILMVGDSIRRDIQPAKKLGMRTALAKYGQDEEERGKADYELKDISDVLKIV